MFIIMVTGTPPHCQSFTGAQILVMDTIKAFKPWPVVVVVVVVVVVA